VVSPDAGGVPRAETFAKRLKSTLAVIIKRRPEPDVSEVTHIVGDVQGKVAVVVDDMISTGGTLVKAPKLCASGARPTCTRSRRTASSPAMRSRSSNARRSTG